MKHLFVTHEIAVKLKELGFNEPCIAFFLENKEIYSLSNPTSDFSTVTNENKRHNISAPLWQQAIDWLRTHETKPIDVYDIPLICWQVQQYDKNLSKHNFNYFDSEDYYKSREQAILKAIQLI